jgi:hypothetical protein
VKNKIILTYVFNLCSPSKIKIYLVIFPGKMISFIRPRQWHQKDVVPEINPKAQIVMSGINNV